MLDGNTCKMMTQLDFVRRRLCQQPTEFQYFFGFVSLLVFRLNFAFSFFFYSLLYPSLKFSLFHCFFIVCTRVFSRTVTKKLYTLGQRFQTPKRREKLLNLKYIKREVSVLCKFSDDVMVVHELLHYSIRLHHKAYIYGYGCALFCFSRIFSYRLRKIKLHIYDKKNQTKTIETITKKSVLSVMMIHIQYHVLFYDIYWIYLVCFARLSSCKNRSIKLFIQIFYAKRFISPPTTWARLLFDTDQSHLVVYMWSVYGLFELKYI